MERSTSDYVRIVSTSPLPLPPPPPRFKRRRVSIDRVPRHLDVHVLLFSLEYINIESYTNHQRGVRHPVSNGRRELIGEIVPSFVVSNKEAIGRRIKEKLVRALQFR